MNLPRPIAAIICFPISSFPDPAVLSVLISANEPNALGRDKGFDDVMFQGQDK